MFQRYPGNPILAPTNRWWENRATFNPGFCQWGQDFVLLYRAVGGDDDHTSQFGLAVLAIQKGRNGAVKCHIKFRTVAPIFGPGMQYDRGATEDPRITRMGQKYYISYSALSKPPKYGGGPPAAALLSTKDFRRISRHGLATDRKIDNRYVVLFPEKIDEYYLSLQRPVRWSQEWFQNNPEEAKRLRIQFPHPYSYQDLPAKPSIWLAYSLDLKHWFNFQLLLEGKEWWENRRLGPSVPPIKTEKGWLIIYHGVSESGYRVGRVLLDLKDPSKVIARSSEPILEPQEKYETEGNVKNVVFPSGGVVLDHTLYLVYGGADKVCCLAFAGLPDLLRA